MAARRAPEARVGLRRRWWSRTGSARHSDGAERERGPRPRDARTRAPPGRRSWRRRCAPARSPESRARRRTCAGSCAWPSAPARSSARPPETEERASTAPSTARSRAAPRRESIVLLRTTRSAGAALAARAAPAAPARGDRPERGHRRRSRAAAARASAHTTRCRRSRRCGSAWATSVEVLPRAGLHQPQDARRRSAPSCSPASCRVEYWNGHDFAGAPALRARRPRGRASPGSACSRPRSTRAPSRCASAARSRRAESGAYQLSLVSAGNSRLFVDGALVVDNWTAQTPGEAFFGLGSRRERAPTSGSRPAAATTLAVEFANLDRPMLGGLKVGCLRRAAGGPARARGLARRRAATPRSWWSA